MSVVPNSFVKIVRESDAGGQHPKEMMIDTTYFQTLPSLIPDTHGSHDCNNFHWDVFHWDVLGCTLNTYVSATAHGQFSIN